MLTMICCTIMRLKNIFAAEDELQRSMNGCMHVEIPQQKGDVLGKGFRHRVEKGLSV